MQRVRTMSKNQDIIWATVWESALKHGREAGAACVRHPMIVAQHANVMDDNSPVVEQWHVPSGVCGFAWVVVRPGTSAFARWLVKHDLAGKHYYGGVSIWVGDYGQSYEKKHAHAVAMAEYLNKVGIDAFPGSRLD
jgi:hypothetical protein